MGSILPTPHIPIRHSVQKEIDHAFDTCNPIFQRIFVKDWTAVYNLGNAGKRLLQVASIKVPKAAKKVGKVTSGFGLLAGINTLVVLSSIPKNLKSFANNVKIGDVEGSIFSGLGNTLNMGDGLDSFITFTGSLTKLGLIPKIAFFSTIGVPLAIVLLGYGTLKGTYDTIRYSIELYQMCKHIDPDDIQSIKKFLDGKLDVSSKELEQIHKKYAHIQDEKEKSKLENHAFEVIKSRKINQLKRHTDAKVVKVMQNLQTEIDANKNLDTAQKAVKDMKTLMRRRITVKSINTVGNGAMLTALVCSTIFPIAAPVVFPTVAGVRAGLKVGTHIYDSYLFDKGLNLPKFAA